MSESGCLVSSSFSTVTVHNEVFTPKVSIETNHNIPDEIHINESGHQSAVEIDKEDLGAPSSTFDYIDLGVPDNIKTTEQTIAQPPSSILKNMYLVVTGNNFLVSAATGVTNLRIGISTDDGDGATEVFEKSALDATIDIVPGSTSDTNNGSILAMNTVIPLVMNYSTARGDDIKNAIDKQGYCRGTPEELRVAIDDGVPSAGKGSLYNKETTSRNLYITLSSSIVTPADLLLGANGTADTDTLLSVTSLSEGALNNGAVKNQVTPEPCGTVTFKIVCDFQLI